MINSKKLMENANIIPKLKLGIKADKGGVVPTGPQKVKLISDSVVNGKDAETGEIIPKTRYIVEDEEGVTRRYDVPVKDKAGELHYLVQALSEIEEGAEVILEMKKRGIKNYISVTLVDGNQMREMVDEDEEIID